MKAIKNYECEGQLSIFDMVEHQPEEELKSETPRNCGTCDVEWCSLVCFERRGYQYDHVRRKWFRNEQGEILRTVYGQRECKNDYDFIPAIADGIKEVCIRWGYDWILKIIENPTVRTFMNTVCRITNTHFFEADGETYGITYSKKDEIGTVYKCGSYCEVKLGDVKIESIIARISLSDAQEFHKTYDESYLRFHISSMCESRVERLKGLSREEFICKESRGRIMDIGDLTTGQRIIVADNLEHRPELPHATWDDYIAMFKEVWGED